MRNNAVVADVVGIVEEVLRDNAEEIQRRVKDVIAQELMQSITLTVEPRTRRIRMNRSKSRRKNSRNGFAIYWANLRKQGPNAVRREMRRRAKKRLATMRRQRRVAKASAPKQEAVAAAKE